MQTNANADRGLCRLVSNSERALYSDGTTDRVPRTAEHQHECVANVAKHFGDAPAGRVLGTRES